MKYRILEKYYRDSLTPYYIVEEKGIFFWKTPTSSFLYDLGFTSSSPYFKSKAFKTFEEAEAAVSQAIQHSNLKSKVVKEIN